MTESKIQRKGFSLKTFGIGVLPASNLKHLHTKPKEPKLKEKKNEHKANKKSYYSKMSDYIHKLEQI